MHNSVQNVQSDLECVGGYQGEINSEERKKKLQKGYILILSKPKRFLLLIFIVIQGRRISVDLGKLLHNNLVTQTFLPLSCMKAHNLTFVGFGTQIFRRK